MSKQKQKGTLFEMQTLHYLQEHGINATRNPLMGYNDVGDITVVTSKVEIELTVECKNHRKMELSEWLDEAERERSNAKTSIGIVVHKRRGCGDANFGKTYVTMELSDLAWILGLL